MSRLREVRTGLWHLRRGGLPALRTWRLRRRTELHRPLPAGDRGAEGIWTGRRSRRRLTFTPAALPQLAPRRPDLSVGVILDEFSELAFGYEWNAVALDPRHWRHQLDRGLDLVFIESAWSGNSGLWRGKLAGTDGPDPALAELLAACSAAGVPTVFWNKEDPPHYADFLPAAKLFDHVFTTDGDRLPDYRRDLGHANVGVLAFAAQPALHNPVRPAQGHRSRDVAFAGMYFAHKYPERRAQMDMLLGGAAEASAGMDRGLEIFSRQLGGPGRYQFPEPLDARVVGSLSYRQMLAAYKAYRLFLNVNTVVDSPSMCARRIFEITASGTPVLTAPSAAVAEFFGEDEMPVARSAAEASRLTRALVGSPELGDRAVHLAQRRIWQGHTYAHRVEQVLRAAVPDRAGTPAPPAVSALVSSMRPHQLEHVFATLAAQQGVDVQLVLLTHGFDLPAERVRQLRQRWPLADVVILAAAADVPLGECMNRCVAAADAAVAAKIDDDDHYGARYLADQVHALGYSRAPVVGKQAHYMYLQSRNATLLRFADREHRFTGQVMGPTIVAARQVLQEHPFPAVPRGEDTGFLRQAAQAGVPIYSADRFNFYQVRHGAGHTWPVADAELLASAELRFYGRPDEHTDI